MIKYEITCPICKTIYMGVTFGNCPVCDWMFWGGETELNDDEYDSTNFTSIREAKKKFAQGLNIWGNPLPKTNPTDFSPKIILK